MTRDRELAYYNVKLFRDHGAERKFSNDVEDVKKSISKLEQQVSEAEMGGGFAKRKCGNNSSTTARRTNRPIMESKYKRTWSMGSDECTAREALFGRRYSIQAGQVARYVLFHSFCEYLALAWRPSR